MAKGRGWDPTIPAMITAGVMVVGVFAATGGLTPGGWKGSLSADKKSIRLDMRLGSRNSETRIGTDAPVSEIEGFDSATFSSSGAPLHLVWKKDAGSFVLEGTGGRHPAGTVRFEPAEGFRKIWRDLDLGALDDGDLLMMTINGVRLADVQSLKNDGVEGLDARGIIELTQDPDALRWVAELKGRGGPVRLDEVYLLRNHGVRPETYRGYERAGLVADVEGMVRLHDHGVDPDYVKPTIAAGIDAHDVEGILRLHDHGVSPEYTAGVKASGLSQTDIEDIVRLHDQGIDTDYVRDLVASKLTALDLEGMVRLHAHGVDTDYVKGVAEFGPGERGVEDAIRLHDSGVSTEYLRSRAARGGARLTTDETIRSWARGGDDVNSSR